MILDGVCLNSNLTISDDMEELAKVAEEVTKEVSDKKEDKNESDELKKDYEDVCFICRRPESKAGKMFKLPNNITVCNDCMHKTMDTVSQFDYQGMLNPQDSFPNIRYPTLRSF